MNSIRQVAFAVIVAASGQLVLTGSSPAWPRTRPAEKCHFCRHAHWENIAPHHNIYSKSVKICASDEVSTMGNLPMVLTSSLAPIKDQHFEEQPHILNRGPEIKPYFIPKPYRVKQTAIKCTDHTLSLSRRACWQAHSYTPAGSSLTGLTRKCGKLICSVVSHFNVPCNRTSFDKPKTRANLQIILISLDRNARLIIADKKGVCLFPILGLILFSYWKVSLDWTATNSDRCANLEEHKARTRTKSKTKTWKRKVPVCYPWYNVIDNLLCK